MNDIVLYVKESYNELIHKVTWPTWASLFSNAKLVIIGTIILSLIIFLMDVASKWVLTSLYNM